MYIKNNWTLLVLLMVPQWYPITSNDYLTDLLELITLLSH
jgi:hypothetical protein